MSSFWSKVAVCFCYTIFHGHLVHSWTLLPSWHACVKPTCCRGHVARHWHCPGCVDSKDVALFSFLNLLRWEWCTLLQKLALGCKYWYGVGVFKISSFSFSPLHHVLSPRIRRAAYSTPFLFTEIFYIFEACYLVSPKTIVLYTEQLPFVFSFLMLFSNWVTHVDSASWDPFYTSLQCFVVCALLGSLGLSPFGLGSFWSTLPQNEPNIAAEAFLDWEEQQGYFMYLVRDTPVCTHLYNHVGFWYNIYCSCLHFWVQFPN